MTHSAAALMHAHLNFSLATYQALSASHTLSHCPVYTLWFIHVQYIIRTAYIDMEAIQYHANLCVQVVTLRAHAVILTVLCHSTHKCIYNIIVDIPSLIFTDILAIMSHQAKPYENDSEVVLRHCVHVDISCSSIICIYVTFILLYPKQNNSNNIIQTIVHAT